MRIMRGIGYVFLVPGLLLSLIALLAAMGGATSGGGALLLGFALVIIGSILVKSGSQRKAGVQKKPRDRIKYPGVIEHGLGSYFEWTQRQKRQQNNPYRKP
jgi:hypothetical protein